MSEEQLPSTIPHRTAAVPGQSKQYLERYIYGLYRGLTKIEWFQSHLCSGGQIQQIYLLRRLSDFMAFPNR